MIWLGESHCPVTTASSGPSYAQTCISLNNPRALCQDEGTDWDKEVSCGVEGRRTISYHHSVLSRVRLHLLESRACTILSMGHMWPQTANSTA